MDFCVLVFCILAKYGLNILLYEYWRIIPLCNSAVAFPIGMPSAEQLCEIAIPQRYAKKDGTCFRQLDTLNIF